MAISFFDILAFAFGFVLGAALGAALRKGVALLVILVILGVVLAWYVGLASTLGLIEALLKVLAQVAQFIAAGIAVLYGDVTVEGMVSLGGMMGFLIFLALPRASVRARPRYVRAASPERRRYVREEES